MLDEKDNLAIPVPSAGTDILKEVRAASGQPVELCLQCQKCSSGCPVAAFTEFKPNKILRLLQLGFWERTLRSPAIWLCTSCETCGLRCPGGIRLSEVWDVLKEIAVQQGFAEGIQPAFHTMFLDSVYKRGRVFETGLMAGYKIRTGQLFSDLDLGLKLFTKGKLPLLPRGISRRKEVWDIFNRCGQRKRKGGA